MTWKIVAAALGGFGLGLLVAYMLPLREEPKTDAPTVSVKPAASSEPCPKDPPAPVLPDAGRFEPGTIHTDPARGTLPSYSGPTGSVWPVPRSALDVWDVDWSPRARGQVDEAALAEIAQHRHNGRAVFADESSDVEPMGGREDAHSLQAALFKVG